MLVNKSPISTVPGGAGGITNANDPLGISKPEKTSGPDGAPQFGDILDQIAKPKVQPNVSEAKNAGLKFSQHALDRMANRGISFKPEDLTRLNDAVEKAAKKGSKETLVLMGDNALIVSVKNRTVVTAMDREAMRENVFTNIDSTVIL